MGEIESTPRAARKSVRRTTTDGARMPIAGLTLALQQAIAGVDNAQQPSVIWSDRGSQLIMFVGKLQVQTTDTMILVMIETDSVEFGLAPLIVRFVFGSPNDPASLVAATDDRALGHPQLAARWGQLFRDVIWAGIVRLGVVEAGQLGLQPAGIRLTEKHIRFSHQRILSVAELVRGHAPTTGGAP